MKIQKVIIKDFKKIKNLEKEINGKNIILLGDNDVGKSSFIQAIEIALGMTEKIPLNSNSEIEIQAGDSKEKYIFKTIVTDGKPKFEVIAPNGMKDRTKSVLCDIVGSIDFDIDKFVELSNSKAGKKRLRSAPIYGLEILIDLGHPVGSEFYELLRQQPFSSNIHARTTVDVEIGRMGSSMSTFYFSGYPGEQVDKL